MCLVKQKFSPLSVVMTNHLTNHDMLVIKMTYSYEMCLLGNHSCVPNAEATFPYNNFTLVMEAVKEIQPGDVRLLYLNHL